MSESVTELGFDSKSLWQPRKFQPNPYPESTWRELSGLGLKTLDGLEGEDFRPLHEFLDLPMAQGTFRHFQNEKIEKLAHMWMLISRSIAGGMWMGWPNDDYDFPALVLAWEESKKRLHVIIDVMPIVDVVAHEWYREKYLDGIEPVFNEYKDLIGPPSTYNWFRALKGPYHIFDGPSGQRERALACQVEYARYWAQVVKDAEPVKNEEYKAYATGRKRTMMRQLRQRDPLGSVLLRILGEELGRKSAIGYT